MTFHEQLERVAQLLKERGRAPHHRDSALHPLSELLSRALEAPADIAADDRVARLEDALSRAGVALADAMPALAPLLGLSLDEARYPRPARSPDRLRSASSSRWWACSWACPPGTPSS